VDTAHIIPFIGGQWDGQREQYHLVTGVPASASPLLGLHREFVFGLRWWTLEELEAAEGEVVFAPRRLPELLRELLLDGPPAEPIDAGV
jgi:hypothetical protein